MGTNVDKAVKMFVQTVKNANNRKTSPYDVTAKVVRVIGDTVYVHIDGGVDETPVKKTIDAKPGDKVKVRLSGGSGWITGNVTAPPTDDSTTKEFINNEFQYIFNKVENSEFGKGADGKDGKDGDPGPGVEKVEIVYCIADDDQLDEDGEPSMVTDDWQSNVPTIDDIPLDEMEEEADASEITDIIADKAYDLGGIVKTVNWVKINGTNFTDYTVEIETDEEGYKSSVIKFADGALPSTISSFVVNYIEGLDPEDIYYIWMRTLTYTTDMEEGDDPEEGVPSIYGTLTAEGGTAFKVRTIIREEKWFCLATAVALGPGQTFEDIQHTEWSTTIPDIEDAMDDFGDQLFYWTRIKYYYSDGTVAYSPPAYDFSAQIAYEVSQAETSQDNHFWSNSSGAFVGHYENEPNRDHVVKVVGEGILLLKDGNTVASFTDSGINLRGVVGGQWVNLASYTNGGIEFNTNVPFTIGNSSSYIKWDSTNKKIIINADTIQMGGTTIEPGMDGRGISSTTVTYAISSSGNVTPSSFPYSSPPSVSQGYYLWTKTVFNYDDGTVSGPSYSVSRQGVDGDDGSDTSSQYLTFNSTTGLFVHDSASSSVSSGNGTQIKSTGIYLRLSGASVAAFTSTGVELSYGNLGYYNDTFGSAYNYFGIRTTYALGLYTTSNMYAAANNVFFTPAKSFFVDLTNQSAHFNVTLDQVSLIDTNFASSQSGKDRYRVLFPNAPNVSAGTTAVYMNSNGAIGKTSSKRDHKRNISSKLNPDLDPKKLYDLPIVQFEFRDEFDDPDSYDFGMTHIGFIADDVDKFYSVAASHDNDGTPNNWRERLIIPAMLKLIQEQHEEIEKLKAKIN